MFAWITPLIGYHYLSTFVLLLLVASFYSPLIGVGLSWCEWNSVEMEA
jgi:hypothetical protein